MNSIKNSRNKSMFKMSSTILVVLLVILVASAFSYVQFFGGNILGWGKNTKNNSIDYEKATEDQRQAGENTKKANAAVNTDGSKPISSGSDPLPAPTPSGNGKPSVDMTVTASNQTENAYQIRTLISAVTSQGACTLTAQDGNKKIVKTSSVQSFSNSSTCQGFDIPLNELTPGQWNVTLTFENSELTGTTSTLISIR